MRLFGKELEYREKLPVRPLLGLSDFVCGVYPELLERIRDGNLDIEYVVDLVNELVDASDIVLEGLSKSDLLVARVDLLFLQMGLLQAQKGRLKEIPPRSIAVALSLDAKVELVARLTNRPACLTYEDLVLLNPVYDRRMLTDGEIGWSEFCFYEVHRLIEEKFDGVVGELGSIRDALFTGNFDLDTELSRLKSAREKYLSTFGELGAVTGDMDPKIFMVFRQYFDVHPVSKLAGPSGQFSITVPTIDVLLANEKIPSEIRSYWEDNSIYFPYDGWQKYKDLVSKIEREGSILSLSAGILPLLEEIGLFDRAIRSFRKKHLVGVEKQVPEAFAGKISGTSGEADVTPFLQKRIDIKHI